MLKAYSDIIFSKINEGKIAIGICSYAKAHGYWTVFFGAQELIKKAFDEHQVGMPEPHFYITQRHSPITAAIA